MGTIRGSFNARRAIGRVWADGADPRGAMRGGRAELADAKSKVPMRQRRSEVAEPRGLIRGGRVEERKPSGRK